MEQDHNHGINVPYALNLGAATFFPWYRSLLGVMGLVFIGMAVLFLVFSASFESTANVPKGAAMRAAIKQVIEYPCIRNPEPNPFGTCERVPSHTYEQARQVVIKKYTTNPSTGFALFFGFLGIAILFCVWLPATIFGAILGRD